MIGVIDPNSPQVGFNIETFRQTFNNTGGFVKPSKFMIYLTPPPKMTTGPLSSFGTQGAEGVQFFCQASVLPGIEAKAFEATRYGYGATQRLPFGPGFGPVPLTIMTDGAGLEWTFFKQWMNLIISFDMSKGIINPNASGTYPFELGYLIDYAVNVDVIQFNDNGEEILEVTLRNAYPLGLSETKLDWSENNVGRFTVFLTYQDWFQTNLGPQQSFGLPETT